MSAIFGPKQNFCRRGIAKAAFVDLAACLLFDEPSVEK